MPLTFGTKYVLRTDILFECDGDNIDKPRGRFSNNTNKERLENTAPLCNTLLEVCQELSLPKESQSALEEIGLLDLTLESFFAPGLSAVRGMLCDIMEEQLVSQLLDAALKY